jgi:ubiquinone/menaquinone biosynthesis C-methylase UbiE
MRVLDLGCGKATSSIFLAREFGIQAWAADGAASPSENLKRAIELQCEASVFPLRVDAHSLPFAKEFFDVVIAIDAFLFFGTDDRYLDYLTQFIKPGGFVGVVDIAFTRELRSIEEAPSYLHPQYAKHWFRVECRRIGIARRQQRSDVRRGFSIVISTFGKFPGRLVIERCHPIALPTREHSSHSKAASYQNPLRL